ncbi:hypothetical protein A3Q56_07911 [Intoshia linei]|uniref:Uncharacterized protein n=1 Tax=Intoshia linei TaxID=1819745 RepID=A0A177AS98_9BILA|nr:hypothetical protein A3Q56_07911 [Intoshia linei]
MKKNYDSKVRVNSHHFNNYQPNNPLLSKEQNLYKTRQVERKTRIPTHLKDYDLSREV